MTQTKTQLSGVALILLERYEQLNKHGMTFSKDQQYCSQSIFQNAAIAILHQNIKEWPEHDMPTSVYKHIVGKTKVEQVAIAGALLAAEIDYINYRKAKNLGIDFSMVATQWDDEINDICNGLSHPPTKQNLGYNIQLAETIKQVEAAILKIPTGIHRLLLTDCNIFLQDLQQRYSK